jgi:hypothetical protein
MEGRVSDAVEVTRLLLKAGGDPNRGVTTVSIRPSGLLPRWQKVSLWLPRC